MARMEVVRDIGFVLVGGVIGAAYGCVGGFVLLVVAHAFPFQRLGQIHEPQLILVCSGRDRHRHDRRAIALNTSPDMMAQSRHRVAISAVSKLIRAAGREGSPGPRRG